jgi:hypothetical protein
LDGEGNTLAQFTEQDGDGHSPMEVLWSRSKQTAVVEFIAYASTPVPFLMINRDGNKLTDLLHAYWCPVWSPTQDLLAYQDVRGENRLLILDHNGNPVSVSKPLSPRMCSICSIPPRWSPDGRMVATHVKISDNPARAADLLTVIASSDGTVSHFSWLNYGIDPADFQWLNNRYLLVRDFTGWSVPVYRYFVFDVVEQTIHETLQNNGSMLPPQP